MSGDRMRYGDFLGTGIVAACVLLGLPFHAAAQFTLTGQFVEEFPGGGTPEDVDVTVSSVDTAGNPFYVRGLQDCVGAATTNCVKTDGKFTVTNLPAGLYRIAFRQQDATHVDEVFNARISGHTDIGVVPLLRTPFDVDLAIGQIPPFGGSIPLAARAQTLWDIPTLPIAVKLRLVQQDVNSAGGTLVDLLGAVVELPGFDFTWPAGLADSGVVTLPPITVRPSAPAGAESCVVMTMVLRTQPDLRLGQAVACGGKQP